MSPLKIVRKSWTCLWIFWQYEKRNFIVIWIVISFRHEFACEPAYTHPHKLYIILTIHIYITLQYAPLDIKLRV